MKKRVFIVHGWGGYPTEGWFPWLKDKLEARGFEVLVPQLPDSDTPRIANWVGKLGKTVGKADQNTYFIGHSLGCATIAYYLETLLDKIKVGGVVFVAGFFKRLTNIEDEPGNDETVAHWLKTPIDLKKVKSHLTKSIAIFSDTDPFVPLDNQDDFKNKLGSEIIIDRHKMGHFSGPTDKITKLPIVLESILKISK